MAQRSLSAPVPALALQDNNIVLLKLSRTLSSLSADTATSFNKKIALQPLPRIKGLGGSVDELGLDLIIQTVTNSRKDGSLILSDERNRPLAKLFCRDGNVIYAKYGKLMNEAAIFQMFAQHVSGQFNFQTTSRPDWPVESPMNRPTQALLLEAHRRIDEIARLLKDLGGVGTTYTKMSEVVHLDRLPEEVRDDAERVWRYLDGGVAIDQLWDIVHLDDYSIYSALMELQRSQQIIELPGMDDNGLQPMQPMEMGPHLLLSPWDEVQSLTVHPAVGRPQVRTGNLIGLLRPNDPYHLLHTMNLPYRAAGSPLFKNGLVVGMHCGMLPLDPQMHALPQHMFQMLWVEGIRQCMEADGGPVPKKPSKNSQGMKRHVIAGPVPNTKIACPKCNSAMVKHAKFCGTCGQKLEA